MSTVGTTTDAATVAAATTTGSGAAIGNAQNQFLKLLITQLKNQDPLSPMDNAQITSQMAQISTVTGIDQLNTTLQSMASSFNVGQSLQATAMIGHNVLAVGSKLALQVGSALGGVELTQAVDDVVVSIHDAAGQLMREINLGPQAAGVLSFQWDGVTDSGTNAAAGSYSFAVAAMQGGNKVSATALAIGLISGVTSTKSGVTLNVNGIGQVALADVKQVL
ncbi:MAG: flagellar hook assembly protein FlgD [Comamonadaceae bacterium]